MEVVHDRAQVGGGPPQIRVDRLHGRGAITLAGHIVTEPLDPLTLDGRKVRAFLVTQQVWSFYNSVVMCDFVGTPLNAMNLEPLLAYVNGVTGWTLSLYEAMKVGERANTLARIFNCREGFTPADDILPQRLHEGIGNGVLKGERIDPDQFLAARRTYYEMAGWNPDTGRPSAAKLAELGLDSSKMRWRSIDIRPWPGCGLRSVPNPRSPLPGRTTRRR